MTRLGSVVLTLALFLPVTAHSRPATHAAEGISSSTTHSRERFEPIPNALAIVDQLSGMCFNWKPHYGGYRDIGCFPSEDVGTSMPEIVEWEIPGQVMNGIRYDRLPALLVEAVKQVEDQVIDLCAQVEHLAQQVRFLGWITGEHHRRLSQHDTLLSAMQSQLTEHQKYILQLQQKTQQLEVKQQQLEQKDRQQDQQIQQLIAMIQALQNG